MITDTKNILGVGLTIKPGDVLYKEVVNEAIARQCASRLTAESRYSRTMKMMGVRFSCRVLLAIETTSKTQLLLRIERIA